MTFLPDGNAPILLQFAASGPIRIGSVRSKRGAPPCPAESSTIETYTGDHRLDVEQARLRRAAFLAKVLGSLEPSRGRARPDVPERRRLTLSETTLRLALRALPSQPEQTVDPTVAAAPRPTTLADLRASGWRPRTVKEELRANLLARLGAGAQVFPGVVGYEETVVPAIENAILAGQDLVFLGERGQAKTRMARLLVGLLDPWLPVVRGGELNDDPLAPVSPAARAIVERDGDATAIDWLPRDRRYAEKLATPDITIADLIGEVDPIKVAEGRYLSDELTLHYGLIPRANRGIFAINELPDLAERIQVGLLNILEERDVQIRGFTRPPAARPVHGRRRPTPRTTPRAAGSSPRSRTASGSQIRTHYPRTLEHEMAIVRQEKHRFPTEDGVPAIVVPAFMEELVAELTHLARRSPEISQRSGVSVRVSVANAEVLEAAALKRAVRLGEPVGAPRVSDLGAVVASTVGKVELETAGDEAPEERIVERLITKALHTTFNRRVSLDDLEGVVEAFEDGFTRRDRRPDAVARVRRLDARGARACRWRSTASGRTTSPTAPRSPRSSPRPSSSCSRGCTSRRRLNKDRIPGGTVYHR